MTFLKIIISLFLLQLGGVAWCQTPGIAFHFSCKREMNMIGLEYADFIFINNTGSRVALGKEVCFHLEAKIASNAWLPFYDCDVAAAHPSFCYVREKDTLKERIQINLLNMVALHYKKVANLLKEGGTIDLRIVTYNKGKEKIVSQTQRVRVTPLLEQDYAAYQYLQSIDQKPSYFTDEYHVRGYIFKGLNEVIQNFPNSTFAILAKIVLVNNKRKQPRLKPLKTAKKTEMKREMGALGDSPYEFIRNFIKETNDRLEKMETMD
jgi:CheY-specific phosphatase CheX